MKRLGVVVLTFIVIFAFVGTWQGGAVSQSAHRIDDPSALETDQRALQSGELAERIAAACEGNEPYFVTARHLHLNSDRLPAGEAALVAFNGRASDQLVLAEQMQIGTVFGLAYDPSRQVVYAAAYHKRSTAFGPGGPGQIYSIDLTSGAVRQLSDLFGGTDRHDYDRLADEGAAQFVGRTSLADIDLDDSGDTLFVANPTTNRIERLSLPSGAKIDDFPHGAAGREWERNSRLFALGFHEGFLYHGVVDSLEFERVPGTLAGYLFRSRPDGSGMTELARFDFDYPRETLSWTRWSTNLFFRGGLGAITQSFAHPMFVDIEFTRDGSPVLGIRDRTVDMTEGLLRAGQAHPGVGDLLSVRGSGDIWGVITDPEHYRDESARFDESVFGGLAAFPSFDILQTVVHGQTANNQVGAQRFFNASGEPYLRETLSDVADLADPSNTNGLGDVESLCPRGEDAPEIAPTATAVIQTATAAAGATQTAIARIPTSIPQSTPTNFDEVIRESCKTENPWSATVCYAPGDLNLFGLDAPTIMGFLDTPANLPIYALAYESEVGAVYGLGYASLTGKLYASAFQKRVSRYGPLGTGGIYRLDIRDGTLELFAQVPNTGPDPHTNAAAGDDSARDWAGRISIGDLDLSKDESELAVVNLSDRRIHRYDADTAEPMGDWPHGALDESWSVDARPFALKYHEGRLFHGLVNSAESSQRRDDLAAYVYSSLPDGSDMRLEATAPLTYTRGIISVPGVVQNPVPQDLSLDWLPWKQGENDISAGRAQMTVYPQPIVADIEFASNGDMRVGLRDRHTDMSLSYQVIVGNRITKPGVALGDVLHFPFDGSGWMSGPVETERFDRPMGGPSERYHVGALGQVEAFDRLLATKLTINFANATTTLLGLTEGVRWYDSTGNPLREENTCPERFRILPPPLRPFGDDPLPEIDLDGLPAVSRAGSPPIAADLLLDREGLRESALNGDLGRISGIDHSEWLPGKGMGDLEVLCGPPLTPTPTVFVSPTPSPTVGASPTPSLTPTVFVSPTITPTPGPIYLPISVLDRCDPKQQPVDVVLVIDASTTMLFETRAGRTKIEAAKDATRRFLDRMRLPADQAGLVMFNAEATVLSDLSGDRAQLDAALDQIANQELTRIHLGIETATSLVLGARHSDGNLPAIVLLTDGRSNPEPVQLALDAAQQAKDEGITVFTVGLGEDVEFEALRQMASRPENFYWAPDGEDLGPIYESIATEIPCPPSAFWPFRP